MASALAQLTATIIACRECPRLVQYREQVARVKKREFSEWEYWGRPLPGLGGPDPERLIPPGHSATTSQRPQLPPGNIPPLRFAPGAPGARPRVDESALGSPRPWR